METKIDIKKYKNINNLLIDRYKDYLYQEEKSINTIKKYIHDLNVLCSFLKGKPVTKDELLKWKEQLLTVFAPSSVNSMLAAINNFLDWIGKSHYKVKLLKIQKKLFTDTEKELTKEEYIRLVETAKKEKNERLSLIMQTICSTGIRVSELRYITIEAAKKGSVKVNSKGKIRVIFLPNKLCDLLIKYCKDQGRKTGIVFCTKNGKPLDRSNIWKAMKLLCKKAKIESEKVFPHNLRHLFARTYYKKEKDLSRLADLLGHTSVNTTKIYTRESGIEHVKQINHLKLLLTL